MERKAVLFILIFSSYGNKLVCQIINFRKVDHHFKAKFINLVILPKRGTIATTF